MPDRAAPNQTHPVDAEGGGPGQQTRRRTVATLVVAALLAAGAWLLIGHAANYAKLGHALGVARPWWLVGALATACFGYLGYALLYQALAAVDDGPRPPLRTTLRLTVAVFGASVIATAAGRLGSEYWSLRRMHERPPSAWSRVLAINTAAWALLAGLALLGALAMLLGAGRGAPLAVELAWVLALPLCALPATYLSSPARRWLTEDRGGNPRRMIAAALRGIVLLRATAVRPPVLGRALSGLLIYWAGELVTVWTALRAFGVDLDPASLVVGFTTGYASTMLPLPVGGAGGVDAATTYGLVLVGVPLGPALLATLVYRLCTYWLPLAVAVLAMPALRRLPGELARVPPPSPA